MSTPSSPPSPSPLSEQARLTLLQEKNADLVKRIRSLSEETRSQAQLIRTLFDFTPFGLVVFDDERRVVQINKVGRELLRKDQLSLIGRTCERVFDCYDTTTGTCPLVNNTPVDRQETHCRDCDCGQTYLRSAVMATTGEVPVIIEAFIDITQIKQAERSKNDFLAKMSHELRTPLNAIVGFTDLLRDELPADSEGPGHDYLNIMQNASRDLEHIIDELMDVAKIRGNNMHLDMHAIDVVELVTQLEQEIQRDPGNGQRLLVNIDASVNSVYADPNRLKQILSHLLANAFKYTTDTPVELQIKTSSKFVDFIVIDQGQGMTEEQLQRVFNEFEQGDNTITRQFGGVGLGLSIAAHLARLMHGELHIQSRLQEGTQVRLSLPARDT